jgi:DNA-binding LacI/PurR family transcriptional regulator
MSTIKEVAELAGVSIGTVSHVIGGVVPVSKELRRKVQAAIRALDYHPNHIARSLKTTKTKILGMVVPDMTIPFFSQLIRSVETAAKQAGYWVLAVDSDDDPARQQDVLSLLRSQRVEGILLVSASGKGSKAQIRKLQASGLPLVCLDRLPDGVEIDSVCIEDAEAAKMGVAHLIELGHRDIAIMTGPLVLRNERERLKGYKTALDEAGIILKDRRIWESTLTNEEVMRVSIERLSRAADRPTALFCTNGVTGMGALRGMAACGLSTPGDLSFVTFDELTPDDLFRPTITSIVQPALEIGHKAAEILVGRLQQSEGFDGKAIAARFQASLKVGESSGAPVRPALAAVRRRMGGQATR